MWNENNLLEELKLTLAHIRCDLFDLKTMEADGKKIMAEIIQNYSERSFIQFYSKLFKTIIDNLQNLLLQSCTLPQDVQFHQYLNFTWLTLS